MTYPAAGHHIVIAEFGDLILIKSIIINQQHFIPYKKTSLIVRGLGSYYSNSIGT